MKKILCVICFLLSQSVYCQTDGVYEMVLYYPIEKHIDSDSVYDISGYRTNGKLYNVSTIEDRFGNPNGAIEFNGVNSYVRMECPYFSNKAYCYSLWAKFYEVPQYGTSQLLVCIGSDYGIDHFLMNTNYYSLNEHIGLLGGGYHADSSHAIVRTQELADVGEWHHILYMRNEEILKLYVDGELVASSMENVQEPFFGYDFYGTLGCRVNGTQFLLGALDDIKIFERMLGDSEIDSIQNQTEIPLPFVEAGNDTIINEYSSEFQLDGKAYVFESIEWSTSGDGYFSDKHLKNPKYYPGTLDLSINNPVNLTMSVKGYDKNESTVLDNLDVLFAFPSKIQSNKSESFSLYPNPTTNIITIKNNQLNDYNVVLLNNTSEILLNKINADFIDISNLTKGIYIVIIKTDSGIQYSQKIVKL